MTKLVIPEAALSMHVIALGKTRSGKSSKLRVLAEHILLEHEPEPLIILDPKGDWWGLKSSADGKRQGFPLVIFGGEHADVPINEHSGAHVAELVATGNRSCLIDLGGWMVGARTRFFIDFASNLFKLARGKRFLMIDECHNFAPKGKILSPEAGICLHWANRLASEGAGKGITIIAASQRPQKVHNDFLTSCETLIACKVLHKSDRDAIKDWIDGCADPELGKQVVAELAQMKKPEAWVWSPEIDFGPKRISWPMFKTYDSFKPQPPDGGKLKGWAEVDLEEVKSKLASVVKEAQANDPKELKKEVAELRKQLAAKPGHAAPPGPTKEQLQAAQQRGEARGYERAWKEAIAERRNLQRVLEVSLRKEFEALKASDDARPPPAPELVELVKPHAVERTQFPLRKPTLTEETRALNRIGAPAMTGAEKKVLVVLGQHPEGCTSSKLALLTGYRYGGGFRNILSALRTKGLIEGENTGTMMITEAGQALGPFEELPTGEDLRRYWLGHRSLSGTAKEALAYLLENPDGVTGEELARATGHPYGGGYRNVLSQLRTAGVMVGKSNTETLRASEELLA